MIADLGGPGPACSALRVRRFVAGELSGVERERMQAHLEGCARCQEALRGAVLGGGIGELRPQERAARERRGRGMRGSGGRLGGRESQGKTGDPRE